MHEMTNHSLCGRCGHAAADHFNHVGSCWHGSLNTMTVRCGCMDYEPPGDAVLVDPVAQAMRDSLSGIAYRNQPRRLPPSPDPR